MINRFKFILLALLILTSCKENELVERSFAFDDNWQFLVANTDDRAMQSFDDSKWQVVNLPHKWNAKTDSTSLSNAEQIAFYKKSFKLALSKDEKALLLFEGKSNRSEYWINGHKLGMSATGKSSFYFELNDYLKSNGSENELLLKVEYRGSPDHMAGLYRNVSLVKVNKLHIPINGTTYEMSSISDEASNIKLNITVKNAYSNHQTVDIHSELYTLKGKPIAEVKNNNFIIKPGSTLLKQNIEFNAELLNNEHKLNNSRVLTKVYINSDLIDVYQTTIQH